MSSATEIIQAGAALVGAGAILGGLLKAIYELGQSKGHQDANAAATRAHIDSIKAALERDFNDLKVLVIQKVGQRLLDAEQSNRWLQKRVEALENAVRGSHNGGPPQ